MKALLKKILEICSKDYFILLFVCLLNCFFTIINKYPVLYSDTSTYLASGFEFETPFDRPITYGILLRIFSLNGLSLFLVPICQSLFFTLILLKVLSLFSGTQRLYFNLFCVSLILNLFTGFSWCINELLPDFLTSVGFLSLICILLKDEKPRKEVLLFCLFFVSAAAHISNVFIFLAITMIIFALRKRFLPNLEPRYFRIKIAIIVVLLGVSYIIMASAISKSKNVFFAGSLASKGILQEVLKDNCKSLNLKMCNYRDSIPPSFEYFVWNKNSPLYKLGGWKECRNELKIINRISFSESKYIFMQLRTTSAFFLKQLTMFDIGEGNGPFGQSTVLIERIKKYTILDDEACLQSRQNDGLFLQVAPLNFYYRAITIISFVLLMVIFLFYYKNLSSELKLFIYLSFITIIISSLLVAFSSEISNRHGCKLIWLITLLNFIILSKNFKLRNGLRN